VVSRNLLQQNQILIAMLTGMLELDNNVKLKERIIPKEIKSKVKLRSSLVNFQIILILKNMDKVPYLSMIHKVRLLRKGN